MCCGLFRCPKLDKNEQCVPLLDKKHNVNMRLQAIANQFGVAGRGLRVFRGETELGRCVHKYCNRLPTHCTTCTVHPSNRHPRNPTTTCFHSTINLQRSKSTRLLSLWECGTAHLTRARCASAPHRCGAIRSLASFLPQHSDTIMASTGRVPSSLWTRCASQRFARTRDARGRPPSRPQTRGRDEARPLRPGSTSPPRASARPCASAQERHPAQCAARR